MFYWKRVFLFALLCLALAGGIARAENEVTIHVAYTGSQTGDEPGVRVYLGTPLTENRPYAEYGTQYERGWLTFVSENTVYRYGMQGSSVVWMLPVSAKRGDVELYLDFAEGLGIRAAYLGNQALSADQPVMAKLTDTLAFKLANGKRRSTVRLIFTVMPVVSVSARRAIRKDSNTAAQLRVTDPDFEAHGWQCATMDLDAVISKRGKTAARYTAKHPYSFSVIKDGKKEDISLAGMRRDSDWILDSAYNDASRFRNRVSMDLWHELYRLPWDRTLSGAVAGTPVEVYIDREYKGVYILSEKQDRKQTGLIKAENGGTGLLLKTQEANSDGESPAGFVSLGKKLPGVPDPAVWYNVAIKYPKDHLTPELWADFYELTKLVVNGTDEELEDRISEYVDPENLARYYLLVNALGLNDNMRKNMVFVRAAETGRHSVFQLLPWDMDAGYGRAYTSRRLKQNEVFSNRLFQRLIRENVGGFRDLLKRTWDEYKNTVLSPDRVMSLFEAYIGRLRLCGADKREMALYPKFRFYMNKNFYYTLDFDRELNYIRDYLNGRWKWLEERLSAEYE